MVNKKVQRITGNAHVEIEGSEKFRSLVAIDFDERSLIFSVPNPQYALPMDARVNKETKPIAITCHFDIMRAVIDGKAVFPRKSIIKMFDCQDPSIRHRYEEDTMRVLRFNDALQTNDARQMTEVFDAVDVSFTDMDLLIGNPPAELRYPGQYIEAYNPLISREKKEEQITVTLTHEPPKTLKWEIEGGDNELTISIWRQTTIGGRPPHLFAAIRGITIKATKPMTHYALFEKGVEPLMAFASLLLGANVNLESMKFWFDGGYEYPSSAVHYFRPYRNDAAPSYDVRSTIRSKEGILYDAIEHAVGFFTAYRKIQLPINQIMDALNAPLYHVTGARLLEATSALQGIVKHFDNENADLKDALENAIVHGDYTHLRDQLRWERNAYAHGDTEEAEDLADTPLKRFGHEHFSLNLVIEYLFMKAELPEEIIKRARADAMPFSLLYQGENDDNTELR